MSIIIEINFEVRMKFFLIFKTLEKFKLQLIANKVINRLPLKNCKNCFNCKN